MTISEIISLGALAISALMMFASMRRGTQSDAATQARYEAKLDNLISGVDDIRLDMRTLKNDSMTHAAKIAELEAGQKSTEHRVDELFTLYRKAHPPDTHHE